MQNQENSQFSQQEFPLKIKNNQILGTFVVAAKCIKTGDVILEENPLAMSPQYDWSLAEENQHLRVCVGCFKICFEKNKCRKCGWPVCGAKCEDAPIHAKSECPIFAANKVLPENLAHDHCALATLRCLLLRDKDPERWETLLRHESHSERRKQDRKTKECREFVINFVLEKCQLAREQGFDVDTVERVLGILATNSFNMTNYFARHTSLIFHKSSYFAHSCDPNVEVVWKLYLEEDQFSFSIKFLALREIEEGEILTHSYVDNWISLPIRQNYLDNFYYFKCDCEKCRAEMFAEIDIVMDIF